MPWEREIMALPKEKVFSERDVNLADSCRSWLEQYKDAYNIMNRVCSSSKGNRYSLQLVTGIHLEENEKGKEYYHFSLDITRTSGDLFLKGPSISIAKENERLVIYLLTSLEKHYLDTNEFNVIQDIKDPFDGYLKKDKRRKLESYRPASVIFDAREVMDDEFLSAAANQEILYLDTNISLGYLHDLCYNEAKKDCEGIEDDTTFKSIEKSNQNYENIEVFGGPVKKEYSLKKRR